MNEQITICGHSAQITKSGHGEIYFTFSDKTQDGANGLRVDLFRCSSSLFAKAWYKAGLTKELLTSWWSVGVTTPDDVLGYKTPWIKNDYNPTYDKNGKGITPTNYAWVMEATEENAKRILEEIVKRAYGSEPSQPEKDKGSDAAKQLTTLQRKYRDLKSKHPDAVLLFRCGDFYETYEEDAKTIHNVLGVTLTKHNKNNMPMAGFPHHALDAYLPKLIRAKLRVAICDNLSEQPKIKKA